MEYIVGIVAFYFMFYWMISSMKKKSSFLGIFDTTFSLAWKIIAGIFSFLMNSRRNTYGSAQWLPEWQADFQSRTADGFSISGTNFIGKENSTQHQLVVAPSGGGKTTCIITPSIENISRHGSGSIVITDPSGELSMLCSSMLTKRGYKVFRLDLSAPDSDTFNPILLAKTSSDLNNLAKTLVTTALGNSSNDPYWNLAAIQLFTTLLTIIKTLPVDQQTFGLLKQWITMIGVEDLREPIDDLAAQNLSTFDYNEYVSFFAKTEKLQQSIISICQAVMQNITSDVDRVTRSSTIDFNELRKGKGKAAIFVSVPEHMQEKLGFVVNIFYESLFSFLYEMPKDGNFDKDYNHVFLLLDEFSNLTIDSMTTHITTLRKRRVGISIIIQSYAQLMNKYGANARTLIGNCKTQVYFPSLDIETCRTVEQSIGMTTYLVKNNPFNPFEKGREMSRLLLQASELRRLEEDKVLVIHGRENPLMLRSTPYYKQRSIMSALKG